MSTRPAPDGVEGSLTKKRWRGVCQVSQWKWFPRTRQRESPLCKREKKDHVSLQVYFSVSTDTICHSWINRQRTYLLIYLIFFSFDQSRIVGLFIVKSTGEKGVWYGDFVYATQVVGRLTTSVGCVVERSRDF